MTVLHGQKTRSVEGVLLYRVEWNIWALARNEDVHFMWNETGKNWKVKFGDIESAPFRLLRDAVNSVKPLFWMELR